MQNIDTLSETKILTSPADQDSVYVYILECRDGTLYTGWTNDIEKRLRAHNAGAGTGAKYTRGRGPVKLVYTEILPERGAALAREAQIKRLPKEKKLALIHSATPPTKSRASSTENPK